MNPTSQDTQFTAVVLDSEGCLATSEALNANVVCLKSIHPSINVDTELTVTLNQPCDESEAWIDIQPINNQGISLKHPVTIGDRVSKIDVSPLNSGWYVVRLIRGENTVIGEQKILKR